jgi:hypothetical protein
LLNKALKEEHLQTTETLVLMKERQREEISTAILEKERVYNQNARLLQLIDLKEKQFLRILSEEGINVGQSNIMFGMANTMPNNLNMMNVHGHLPIQTDPMTVKIKSGGTESGACKNGLKRHLNENMF